MKFIQTVWKNDGEIANTYSLCGLLENFSQDQLNEKCWRLVNHDFWQHIEVPLYEIHEAEIPDWMDAGYYIKNYFALKYTWGVSQSRDFDQKTLEALMSLDFTERYFAIKLIEVKKHRSEFRRSLAKQFAEWVEVRKYSSPFSEKQWDALINRKFDAKNAEAGLYRIMWN